MTTAARQIAPRRGPRLPRWPRPVRPRREELAEALLALDLPADHPVRRELEAANAGWLARARFKRFCARHAAAYETTSELVEAAAREARVSLATGWRMWSPALRLSPSAAVRVDVAAPSR